MSREFEWGFQVVKQLQIHVKLMVLPKVGYFRQNVSTTCFIICLLHMVIIYQFQERSHSAVGDQIFCRGVSNSRPSSWMEVVTFAPFSGLIYSMLLRLVSVAQLGEPTSGGWVRERGTMPFFLSVLNDSGSTAAVWLPIVSNLLFR